MTDGTVNGPDKGAGAQGAEGVKMHILAQFIRDLSFENILAQKGIQGEVTPEVQVQVSLDAKKRQTAHQYELVMKFKVGSKNKTSGDPLFLLELDYGAVFHVENVPEEQIHPFLLIECPRMVFPFARRIVSDVTRDGGFPPVNLDVVDFVTLYKQEIARRAADKDTVAKKTEQPTQ
jgi:preprotein translocase subunit SecB